MFEIIDRRYKELGETGGRSSDKGIENREKKLKVINPRINKIGSTDI